MVFPYFCHYLGEGVDQFKNFIQIYDLNDENYIRTSFDFDLGYDPLSSDVVKLDKNDGNLLSPVVI